MNFDFPELDLESFTYISVIVLCVIIFEIAVTEIRTIERLRAWEIAVMDGVIEIHPKSEVIGKVAS